MEYKIVSVCRSDYSWTLRDSVRGVYKDNILKSTKYDIDNVLLHDLETQVNKLLSDGWILTNNPILHTSDSQTFSREMTRSIKDKMLAKIKPAHMLAMEREDLINGSCI